MVAKVNKKGGFQIPILVAAPKKSGKASPKAQLEGHEQLVDECVSKDQQRKSLESELKLAKEGTLVPAAREAWQDSLRGGLMTRVVIMKGTEHQADATFKNWQPVGAENEDPMRAALGEHYDTFFESAHVSKPHDAARSRDIVLGSCCDGCRDRAEKAWAVAHSEEDVVALKETAVETLVQLRAQLPEQVFETILALLAQRQIVSVNFGRTLKST